MTVPELAATIQAVSSLLPGKGRRRPGAGQVEETTTRVRSLRNKPIRSKTP